MLATNVAETSLTVPGIRYVVDGGQARIKRYSIRNKIEQLKVEKISRASANQRAGRCGRVAEGICIRLYDEQDFEARPQYTTPELLRSSLAGVILRMKSLRLPEIDVFPFLDPPASKRIRDGQALLRDLDALDERDRLTKGGRELGQLPLDPRVGRILIAAREKAVLHEVLVIAAFLAGQCPRVRPLERQAVADRLVSGVCQLCRTWYLGVGGAEGGSELAGEIHVLGGEAFGAVGGEPDLELAPAEPHVRVVIGTLREGARAHRGGERRAIRVGRDHVEVVEGADNRAPHVEIGFAREQPRHRDELAKGRRAPRAASNRIAVANAAASPKAMSRTVPTHS